MQARKLFAGVVAAATLLSGMVFGAATASAADSPTITVNNSQAGHTYTAYKFATFSNPQTVGEGENATTTLDVSTDEGWNDVLKTAVEGVTDPTLTVGDEYANNYAAYIATLTPENLRKLADQLKTVTPPAGQSAAATVEGAAGQNAVLNLAAEGWYLVTDSNGSTAIVASTLAGAAGNIKLSTPDDQKDITAVGSFNAKGAEEAVSPTKTRDKDNASIGDVITYTLIGKVPSDATAGYLIFRDKPGTGLTISRSDLGFTYQVSDDGQTYTDADMNDFDVDTLNLANGSKGNGEYTFTVKLDKYLTAEKLAAYAGKWVKITYQATVNDDAAGLGSVVNSILQNDGTYKQADETKLYGFQFGKKDAEGNPVYNADPTKNVQFQVKSGNDVLRFIPKDGTYYKAEVQDPDDFYFRKDATATLTTDAQGKIKVGGLGDGTYTVEETKVAEGFQDIKATFTVTIANGVATFAGTDATGLAPKATPADGDYEVTNVKSITQLPLTGAAGIAMFGVVAAALLGAGAFGAVRMRRQASAGRSVRA